MDGAKRCFSEHGARLTDTYVVPGAFELPLAAKLLAATDVYDGIVCLGCVIRGETAHFDYVAGEAARGIQQVALDTEVPIGFGVLTTEDVAQAQARSGEGTDNKGWEVARSVIEMVVFAAALPEPDDEEVE